MEEQKIICDGRIISKEDNPAAYNTLKNVWNYCFEHKVDENDFCNPRIRMYYALDNNLQLHCSPLKDRAMECINKFEDEVVMNISTFNKLKALLDKNSTNAIAKDTLDNLLIMYKQSIIEYLQESGLSLDETIESSNNYYKFIAWSLPDFTWHSLEKSMKSTFKALDDYVKRILSDLDISRISFNVRDCECLTDKDTDDKLFRTLVNFRINE